MLRRVVSISKQIRFNKTRTMSSRSDIGEELEKLADERYQKIRQEHLAPRDEFPEKSHGDEKLDADTANRKRIIYRSKQRGWLEVDLLLGSWAVKNVMNLSAEELKQYEDILNEETIDIFNFITGKDAVPERINTPMLKRLQEYSLSKPIGTSPEEYASNKKFFSN